MSVKIKYGYPEIVEETVSDIEWYKNTDRNDEIWLYRNNPVYSYEYLNNEKPIEQKKTIVRESVSDFIKRRKLVSCIETDCTKAGIHLGNLCNIHYEKTWRILKKKGVSFTQFETWLRKRNRA